jgi:hypothetical protein
MIYFENQDERELEIERRTTLSIDARIDTIYMKLAERKNELQLDPGTEGIIVTMYLAYKSMQVCVCMYVCVCVCVCVCMHSHIQRMTERMKAEDRQAWLRSEWVYASHAVDRLCLVILFCFIAASILFIFFSAPYLTVEYKK